MSRQIINETCALQIPDHFEILSGKDLDGMRQGMAIRFAGESGTGKTI